MKTIDIKTNYEERLSSRLKYMKRINIKTTPIEILDMDLFELAKDLSKENRHKYQFNNRPDTSKILKNDSPGVRPSDIMQGVKALAIFSKIIGIKTLRELLDKYSFEKLLQIVPNFGEIRAVQLYKFIENIDYK
ncbi:MAG: hypothetical protein ACRCXT_00755, partial [Paraclostridium sp.]